MAAGIAARLIGGGSGPSLVISALHLPRLVSRGGAPLSGSLLDGCGAFGNMGEASRTLHIDAKAGQKAKLNVAEDLRAVRPIVAPRELAERPLLVLRPSFGSQLAVKTGDVNMEISVAVLLVVNGENRGDAAAGEFLPHHVLRGADQVALPIGATVAVAVIDQ